MEKLSQTRSASLYSVKFNELVSALETAHVSHPVKYLCIKYLQGLKPHLHTRPKLFHIDNNLNALQKEAERLYDVMFRLDKKHSSNVTSVAHPRQQSFPSFHNAVPDVNDPMDLSNIQQQSFRKLTPEQKQLFRQKGWCVYCQSHEHDTDHCSKLQAH
ncbi:hypothetical protein HDU98_003001, partial [Podochytrium sp. JEL0797]